MKAKMYIGAVWIITATLCMLFPAEPLTEIGHKLLGMQVGAGLVLFIQGLLQKFTK